MCGIAGFCLNSGSLADPKELAGSLLTDIEHRGYHATGSAWIDVETKQFRLLKKDIRAKDFIKISGDTLCSNARTAILHTRWATQGTPKNNSNNHPLMRGEIALTHNGHITNDNELFKHLNVKRFGQVDSEAVSALIAFTAKNYHPTEVLGAIRGTAALAWINALEGADTLHLARVNSSPLWVGQTRSGSIVYASTLEAIRNGAWWAYDDLAWEHEFQEGEYMRVKSGVIQEYLAFDRRLNRTFATASWKDVAIEKAMREQLIKRSTIRG